MMRRNKALAILIISTTLVASLSLALIYTHDNPVGLTPISSINSGTTPIGSNVTIKGEIASIVVLHIGLNFQFVSISDGTGNLTIFWTEMKLDIGWNIIIQGTVHRNNSLKPVSNVELVLLFP